MEKKSHTRDRLAINLRYLMKRSGWTERDLEKKCGVAQKTINNLLNERTSPNLDTVQQVAEAFGLNLINLISENLKRDLEGDGTLAEIVKNFHASSDEGKDFLLQTSRREAGRRP